MNLGEVGAPGGNNLPSASGQKISVGPSGRYVLLNLLILSLLTVLACNPNALLNTNIKFDLFQSRQALDGMPYTNLSYSNLLSYVHHVRATLNYQSLVQYLTYEIKKINYIITTPVSCFIRNHSFS